MIKNIYLPEDISLKLIDYCERIVENSTSYITSHIHRTNTYKLADDIYSNVEPIISDGFIASHNLSTTAFNGSNLQTCLYANLEVIAFPPCELSIQIIKFLENTINRKIVKPSGAFLYPKNGYMGWHTNSNSPGIRVYITYSPKDRTSYFKYVDTSNNNTKVITDWDKTGITVRVFEVSDDPSKYLWHCVRSTTSPRISFGYKFE